MIRVSLTEAQREELVRRSRAKDIMPRTRDRLEMVRLSDSGWRAPAIAKHMRLTEETVRIWLKRFLAEGFDGLPDQPHLGQQSSVPPAALDALIAEISKGDRSWTSPQAAIWLREHQGIAIKPAWVGRLLKRRGLTFKRTRRVLRHKQDPEAVTTVRAEMAVSEKRAVLER